MGLALDGRENHRGNPANFPRAADLLDCRFTHESAIDTDRAAQGAGRAEDFLFHVEGSIPIGLAKFPSTHDVRAPRYGWPLLTALRRGGNYQRRHLRGVLKPEICLFPDGGWKISSTSNNSCLSKVYLCQFIASEILGEHHGKVGAAVSDYRKEEDTPGDFIEECTAQDLCGSVAHSSLFKKYQEWATDNGMRFQVTKKAFAKQLREKGWKDLRKPNSFMR